MVYFALSLFGMYEIELPRGLAQFTNAREDKGGYAGVIFMALTFTITSFTCTGPFLGPFLVAANETKMSFGDQVISAIAYSFTFAAPFFVLALFPNLTKRLPKSGGWLNSVKVVMGLIERAMEFKFISNSDLAFTRPADLFQLRIRPLCLDRPVAGLRTLFAGDFSTAARFACGAFECSTHVAGRHVSEFRYLHHTGALARNSARHCRGWHRSVSSSRYSCPTWRKGMAK